MVLGHFSHLFNYILNNFDFLGSIRDCGVEHMSAATGPQLPILIDVVTIYINVRNSIREAFNKKKTEKSDIVQKGRVGWTPKPYFRKE